MTDDYRAGLRSFPRDRAGGATLDVKGSLPDWLDGTLVRNGPGAFRVGGRDLTHWVDGLALPRRYGFAPAAETVDYRVRFLESETYAAAREGRLATDQFGTAAFGGGPVRAVRDRIARLTGPTLTDNASVSVVRVGGRLAAVTETPRMVPLDPETLAAGATFDHGDGLDLTGSLGHVHHDPERGVYLNLGVRYGRESEYVLTRRPEGATAREAVGRVPVERPSYVHSFALAGRYAVVPLSPWVTRPRRLLAARTFSDAFRWRPERGLRFVVVDRRTGETVVRARTDPAFVFHAANGFVEDGDVVVDLVAYPDARAVTALSLAALRSDTPGLPAGALRRYRVPLDGGPVAARTLHEGAVEFPTLDYGATAGRGHRWLYLAATDPDPPVGLPTRVERLDLATGERSSWARPGRYVSEPLFVPRTPPGDRAETSEGVLLVEVLDPAADETALVVLDAATLDRRARVRLPARLPLGFHGQYLRPGRPHGRSMA